MFSLRQPIKKYLILFILVVTAASVILKFSMKDHGLPFFGTGDAQHFDLAVQLYQSFSSENPAGRAKYQEITESKEPTKYPLFLTYSYLHISKFLNLEFLYPQAITYARILNIVLFTLTIGLIYFLPISFNLRLTSIGLYSLSLMAHQYSTIVRIHAPTGFFVFLNFLINLWVYRSRHTCLPVLFSSFFIGVATGSFFSGSIGIFGLSTALLLKTRSLALSKHSFYFYLLISLIFSTYIFSLFKPNLYAVIKGEASFFNTTDYPDQALNPSSLLYYLNDVFAVDPLIYFGYFFGLYSLWRSKDFKSPFWLILLVTVIPYHLSLGLIDGSDSRRTSLIIPMMSIVSAYGWIHVFQRKRKMSLCFLFPLVILSLAALVKYTHLSLNDTRQAVYKYIRATISEDTNIILDHGIPDITKNFKNFDTAQYDCLRLDPPPKSSLPNLFSASLVYNNFKAQNIHYYISNVNHRHKTMEHIMSAVVDKSELVKSWDAGRNDLFPVDNSWWPNITHFLLWRIWFMDRAGPTIEIYKMPWAKD